MQVQRGGCSDTIWFPDAVASLTAKPCDPGRSQVATLLDCSRDGWLWQWGVHQSCRDVFTEVVSNVLLGLAFMACNCLQQDCKSQADLL